MRLVNYLMFCCCLLLSGTNAVENENGVGFGLFNKNLIKNYMQYYYLTFGYILHCNFEEVYSVARMFKNEPFYFAFIDISMECNLFSSLRLENRVKMIAIDATCLKTEECFEIASENEFFNRSYNWMIFSDDLESAGSLLSHQNINIGAEITVAVPGMEEFLLYDVYNPSYRRGGNLNITEKGVFHESTGSLKMSLTQSKYERRSNLHGLRIEGGIVATNIKPGQSLMEYLASQNNQETDAQHRMNFQLFQILQDKFNFTINYHRSNLWGVIRNGTWNGVIGMLQRYEIDICVTPARFITERIDVCDFLSITYITEGMLVFRHPENAGLRNIFLQPFSTSVWLIISLTIVVSSMLMLTTFRWQYSGSLNFDGMLSTSIITAIGILCQQGFFEYMRKISTRITLSVMIVFSILIFQFYSSFIVGSLLTSPPKTINTLKDLIGSDLKVGIEDISYNKDYFETTNDELAIELFNKKLKQSKTYYNLIEGIELMKHGGFAFHCDVSYSYRIIKKFLNDREICDLHEIRLYAIRPLAASVPKGGPFKELFGVGLLQIIDSGIQDYHDHIWRSRRPSCVKSNTEIKAVSIKDSSSIFVFLLSGIIFSCFVLCLEILQHSVFIKRSMVAKTKNLKKK